MFPQGLQSVLVHIVEEYFDEWIARTMVHYRWHRATGVYSDRQKEAAEEEYVRIF